MNNAPALLKTLIVYAVIVPLAVFIGYLLTNPLDYATFGYAGVLGGILLFPLMLKWHQPLLVLSWNMGATVFLMPGRPQLWLVMSIVSLVIVLLHRALGGVKHLISVPSVTGSLIAMVLVVLFTARMTGMGLRSMGNEVYGGRHYVYFLGAIMGYFAMSAQRIPLERAGLYVGLLFLGGLALLIGDLFPIMPGPFRFIFQFFPPNQFSYEQASSGVLGLRIGGASPASMAIFSYMLARYGIRGVFLAGKRWRWIVFILAVILGIFGGFRSSIIFQAAVFGVQFYIEGLHRTKLLPIFGMLGILCAVMLVPLVPRLPYSIQRTLSFLPVAVNPEALKSADDSSKWRFDMWKALWPQVVDHLLVGKGYAVSANDFNTLTGEDAAIHVAAGFEGNQWSALAGAYHSGPLSVILTLGIWGVIATIWFWAAGIWVVCRNYRYGPPELQTVNTFFMVYFIAQVLNFLFVFGELDGDMWHFCGLLGLSVALNGGVCQPASVPVRATGKYQAFVGVRAHLQPALRRHQSH